MQIQEVLRRNKLYKYMRFRAYNSLQESISDYFDLITKSERYRKACVSANSPLECITANKKWRIC